MYKPNSTENKEAYCRFGESKEVEFVNQVAGQYGLDATINPKKAKNKFAPDLIVNGQEADLKTQLTPFFTAGRYGKNPQTTVTFNLKDYTRYKEKYPGIDIYFWVEFEDDSQFGASVSAMSGVWKTSLDKITELIESGDAPLHAYQRRVNDNRGNAKESFLIDLGSLEKVTQS